MHSRRLVKAGQSSHTVSLPKGWLEKNKLTRGDIVHIKELSDTELMLSATRTDEPEPERKEITIGIDKKETGQVQREITAAYINSYRTITLAGDEISSRAKELRRALHDFVALEIEEQTTKRIVAKDLLNLNEISIDKTLRRMDMIVRSMFQDSSSVIDGKKIYESVALRDYDINRLYFLLLRMFKSSMKEPFVAQKFGLKGDDVLNVSHLAIALESTADYVKNSCRVFSKLARETNVSELKKLWKSIEQLYLDAMKAHYDNSKQLAHSVAQNREQLFEDAANYFSENRDAASAEITENLKSIVTLVCNIARTVIDRE